MADRGIRSPRACILGIDRHGRSEPIRVRAIKAFVAIVAVLIAAASSVHQALEWAFRPRWSIGLS